uniref:US2_1 n=1 Tax=Human herpesvirus 2 TaxID=10310 RepID=A0A481TQB6_HHV2|nr:US2_1 [Human alphaherpesvirus 2]
MKTNDAWVGEPWPLPDRFLPERTVSWTPFPAAPNHPLENLLSRYEYQYGVVVPGPGDRERSCLRWLRSLVAPHNKPRPASSRPHPATHPTQRPCFTCMGRPEIPDEPSWQTGDDDPQKPGPPLAVGDEWPPSSHVCYPITNL